MSQGGEKTEQPTHRRRSDARRRGTLIRSNELKSAVTILVAVAALKYFGPGMKESMAERFTTAFSDLPGAALTVESTPALLGSWGLWGCSLLLPMLLVLVGTGLAVTFLIQGGFVFTTEPLSINLNRLNPVSGLRNVVSARIGFSLFRDVIKVCLIGYVCYRVVKDAIFATLERPDIPLADTLANVSNMVVSLGFRAGFVLLLLGFLDYAYMRREYFKDLMMTKHEVKDETKQTEGDPLIRGRIRSMQRQIARRRMMAAVPNADVVLTNPTHIAVALKYEPGKMNAPRVVAKGQRLIAEKIKEIARKFGIPVIEDRFLARSLFQSTEVDEEIPADLYRAVAEVLTFVYRLKGRTAEVARER
jgi:flagellar biosynthetic protein FlhB